MIQRFQYQDEVYEVELEPHGESYWMKTGSEQVEFSLLDEQPGSLTFNWAGRLVRLVWAIEGDQTWLFLDGCSYVLRKPEPASRRRSSTANTQGQVLAPMPAQVRSLEVFAGEPVVAGQPLLLLEAMKMEIRISAPIAGQITELRVQVGQTVSRDELLLVIEPQPD
jgi:acetyl/propionyl-CoA carboxylase alpha subunit